MTISPPDALLGARKPRVRSVPRYSTSAGDEAVDLAASAGLHLDPWQQDVLRDALGEDANGRWVSRQVGLIVPRQNGKGSVLEARELFGLFLAGERLLVHTAHEMKTAKEAFRRVESLIKAVPHLEREVKKFVYTNGDEAIELRNGARLRFLARSKGSGRGFTADVVIYDEAYALTDEQVEASVPTMSAVPNSQTWYTSSPPLDAASGEPLFKLRDQAATGSPRIAFYDWSAEPGCDLDDPAIWAGSNPALGVRITLDAVALERAAMSDEGFARERLGVWPIRATDGWAVIAEADWRACSDMEGELADPVAFAIDVTPDRTMTTIAVAGRRPDGLQQVEIIDRRRGTHWVVDRVKELQDTWQPCAIVLDVVGPGGSLADAIEASGVSIVRPTVREVAASCGAFYDAVCGVDEDGEPAHTLRHRDDPSLTTALQGAVKRTLGDAWAWNRRDARTDLSPLISATLALWAVQRFGGEPVNDWDYVY